MDFQPKQPSKLLIPPKLFVALAIALLLATCSYMKGRKSAPEPAMAERLKVYFRERERQARNFATQEGKSMAPEVWPFFAAGKRGDWHSVTNLYFKMAKRSYQFDNPQLDERLTTKAWQSINECFRVYEQLALAEPRYTLRYAHELTNAIPINGVLLAGTDPGRFLPTFLADAYLPQTRLFVISPHQLADGLYLDYLRNIYSNRLETLSPGDAQQAYEDYIADADTRFKEGKLKPNEYYSETNHIVSVKGIGAIMELNSRLARTLFDKNPDLEFFVDPAFPIEWMYPHLIPQGLVFKLNQIPLDRLPESAIQREREFWDSFLAQAIGPWVKEETTVDAICEFAERVYLRKDDNGFAGDPVFARSVQGWKQLPTQRSVAKLFATRRSFAASLFVWRSHATKDKTEKEALLHEADYAFRQALALCPVAPEVIFGYVNLLSATSRPEEALSVAEIASRLDADNESFRELVSKLQPLAKPPTR